MTDHKLPLSFYGFSTIYILKSQMPEHMVKDLNDYLDGLRKDKDKQSAAGGLVGQIKNGEQLEIDVTNPKVQDYTRLVVQLAAQYIKEFSRVTGIIHGDTNFKIENDSTWSVHSYEGDYNPIHDHGTRSMMGISTTTWTKIPKQIQDQPDPNTQISWLPDKKNEDDEEKGSKFDLFHSSGVTDGYLTFYGGRSSQRDGMTLRDAGKHIVKPVVGTIYIFPSWLEHGVNPFRGPGERRTVATNLNVWDVGSFRGTGGMYDPEGMMHTYIT